jgi:hypothetical protein
MNSYADSASREPIIHEAISFVSASRAVHVQMEPRHSADVLGSSTVRMTGVSKNTISKLLLQLGAACTRYQNETLRNLPCKRLQADEIWSPASPTTGGYA